MATSKTVAILMASIKQLNDKDVNALLDEIDKHKTAVKKKNTRELKARNSAEYVRCAREIFLTRVVNFSEKKEGYTFEELNEKLSEMTKKFAGHYKLPFNELKCDLLCYFPKKFDINKVKFFYHVNSINRADREINISLWFDAGKSGLYYSYLRIWRRRRDKVNYVNNHWGGYAAWEKLGYKYSSSSLEKVREAANRLL